MSTLHAPPTIPTNDQIEGLTLTLAEINMRRWLMEHGLWAPEAELPGVATEAEAAEPPVTPPDMPVVIIGPKP